MLTAFLTLLSVPVFIKALGLELYGIFALVSVVGNLNFIINFGLNSALLVYVAKQGKCRESDLDIAITRILFMVMILIVSTIAMLCGNYIIRNVLNVPEEYLSESKSLFYLLILSNAVLLLGQTYTAILDALQKIHITNICQFVYSAVYWIGIIVTVKLGGRLPEVGFMVFSAAIVWFIILFIISRRVWGKLDIGGLLYEFRRVAKKQLSYGTKIYASGLVGFLFEPFSKILLSNFIGLNAVGLYEIGLKVKGQVISVFTKAIYPLLPFIADKVNDVALKEMLVDLSKKILLITIPIALTLAFSFPILVKLWLVVQNAEMAATYVIALTVTVLLFSFPILPTYQYLIASHKADKTIWMQFFSVVFNFVLFICFYKILGLYTIILSNLAGYLVSFLLGSYYQQKYLGANFSANRVYYLKLLGLGVICLTSCIGVHFLVRMSLFDLVIYPVVIVTLSTIYARWQNLITQHDLTRYFSTLPRVKKSLAFVLISNKAST